MAPALVVAAAGAPLLRPEPWSAVAHQQASSADGALTGATAATGGRHTARASNGSRWPTGRPHARTLWACGRDGPGLSSLRAEDGRVPPRLATFWSVPFTSTATSTIAAHAYEVLRVSLPPVFALAPAACRPHWTGAFYVHTFWGCAGHSGQWQCANR